MKIFITGAAGKVGKFIVSELEKDHEVTLFDVVEVDTSNRFIKGDITRIEEVQRGMQGMKAVIHLAAIPLLQEDTMERVRELMQINVMGTFNVLEAAAREGIKKVIFASSICVYGFIFWKTPFTPDYFPIDENHPCKPDDAYGISKLVGESLCCAYARRYNMSVICLRMGSVWFPSPPYRNKTKQDQEKIRDDPKFGKDLIWDYVDVRDVAQAYCLALEKENKDCKVYNIGANDICVDADSLGLIKRHYPEVKCISNKDGFLTNPNKALYDITKAKRELAYQPRFTWRDYI